MQYYMLSVSLLYSCLSIVFPSVVVTLVGPFKERFIIFFFYLSRIFLILDIEGQSAVCEPCCMQQSCGYTYCRKLHEFYGLWLMGIIYIPVLVSFICNIRCLHVQFILHKVIRDFLILV